MAWMEAVWRLFSSAPSAHWSSQPVFTPSAHGGEKFHLDCANPMARPVDQGVVAWAVALNPGLLTNDPAQTAGTPHVSVVPAGTAAFVTVQAAMAPSAPVQSIVQVRYTLPAPQVMPSEQSRAVMVPVPLEVAAMTVVESAVSVDAFVNFVRPNAAVVVVPPM